MTHTLRLCLAAAAAALLTACGGGGSDPDDRPAVPVDTVPDSATASVRAYTEFVAGLVGDRRGQESRMPLRLDATAAPVSESAAPMPVQ